VGKGFNSGLAWRGMQDEGEETTRRVDSSRRHYSGGDAVLLLLALALAKPRLVQPCRAVYPTTGVATPVVPARAPGCRHHRPQRVPPPPSPRLSVRFVCPGYGVSCLLLQPQAFLPLGTRCTYVFVRRSSSPRGSWRGEGIARVHPLG
jgi:hypothetical protein